MLLEIFLAMVVGIILGIITGLTPGFHINSVAAILLAFSPFILSHFHPLFFAAIIVSMSITHVFFDFIPSVFLGAPEEATALAVLPGHRLLLKGNGLLAVRLSILGCLFGLLIIFLLTPLLVILIPKLFPYLQPFIGIILIAISFFVIMQEKSVSRKLAAFSIFAVSGIFGVIVFQLSIKEPLLPMLAGLFGISTLVKSIIDGDAIPEQQEEDEIKIESVHSMKALFAGIFSGSIVSIFPAIGPAQSAVLGKIIIHNITEKAYLVMLGCISSVSTMFALITLFSINKARNGTIAIMSDILTIDKLSFLVLMLIMLISGCIAAILALNCARYFSKLISRLPYRIFSLFVIVFIFILVFLSSGALGVAILITSSSIGLLAISTSTGRHNAMGCLTLPVILYYL